MMKQGGVVLKAQVWESSRRDVRLGVKQTDAGLEPGAAAHQLSEHVRNFKSFRNLFFKFIKWGYRINFVRVLEWLGVVY